MPYKCVNCGKVADDGSQELLRGCESCQGKFFFYIRKEKLDEIEKNMEAEVNLSSSEKKQMEQDIRDIVGVEDEEKPVFLDFESIKILKPGKYLLDISRLLEKNQPKVYQLEDGKYVVDLSIMKPSEEDK
jgi:predicted  nucleic acid-binding Zn-ribbon protein